MAEQVEVEDFLAHHGIKGMKWGKRKPEDSGGDSSSVKSNKGEKVSSAGSGKSVKSFKGEKIPSAGKQSDMDIKAARARLNEGKSVVRKLINMDSFGKPLGGRQLLELNNKGNSPEDIALASRMTRGQKTALAVVAGATILLNVAARAR